MSYSVGDKVTYKDQKAVVTSVTPSGFDVASTTEQLGGKCRQIHFNVNAGLLEDGWPEAEEPDPIKGPTTDEE